MAHTKPKRRPKRNRHAKVSHAPRPHHEDELLELTSAMSSELNRISDANRPLGISREESDIQLFEDTWDLYASFVDDIMVLCLRDESTKDGNVPSTREEEVQESTLAFALCLFCGGGQLAQRHLPKGFRARVPSTLGEIPAFHLSIRNDAVFWVVFHAFYTQSNQVWMTEDALREAVNHGTRLSSLSLSERSRLFNLATTVLLRRAARNPHAQKVTRETFDVVLRSLTQQQADNGRISVYRGLTIPIEKSVRKGIFAKNNADAQRIDFGRSPAWTINPLIARNFAINEARTLQEEMGSLHESEKRFIQRVGDEHIGKIVSTLAPYPIFLHGYAQISDIWVIAVATPPRVDYDLPEDSRLSEREVLIDPAVIERSKWEYAIVRDTKSFQRFIKACPVIAEVVRDDRKTGRAKVHERLRGNK